jgi:hypothetical protein
MLWISCKVAAITEQYKPIQPTEFNEEYQYRVKSKREKIAL